MCKGHLFCRHTTKEHLVNIRLRGALLCILYAGPSIVIPAELPALYLRSICECVGITGHISMRYCLMGHSLTPNSFK